MFFIHVPKCGGTSVGSALRARCFWSQATVSIHESTRLTDLLWPEVEGVERIYREYEVRDILAAQLVGKRVRCIAGHTRFRPEFLSNLEKRHFVTVLRDPVSRFISHYEYIMRRHRESLSGSDFDEFLQSDQARRFGSEYLFYFSGSYQIGLEDTRSAVDEACQNLSRLDLVGDLSQLDTFRKDLGELLGVWIPRWNRNRKPRHAERKFSQDQLKQIEELCAPDIAIYERVSGL